MDHCYRLLFSLFPGAPPGVFYWRNYRGQEVDIVLSFLKKTIPLEVKYQPRITNADLRPVLDFLEQFPRSPLGIVATKETLERRGKVVLIPVHLLLLAF